MTKQDNLHDICCKCGNVFLCYDSPMLKNDLWESICPEEDDWWQTHTRFKPFYVCIDCMEKILRRPLTEDDLLLSIHGKHVIWNTRFVRGRFPDHKYGLEQDSLDRAVAELKREMGLE